MFNKTTKPQTATVQDHPEYREAADKLAELRERFAALDAEIEAARRSRAEIPAPSSRIEDQARELLSGGGAAVATRLVTLEAIDEMTHRRGVLKEAIRLQEQRVEAVRGEIGREIAMAARPEYEAIVRRMAAAVQALSEAADEEAAFRERMNDQRISFASVVPPMPLESARLSVYGSRANRWADEAERDLGIVLKNRRREP